MKYAVLMYQDEKVWAEATEEEQAGYFEAHARFDAAVRDRAAMLAGVTLAGVESATTLSHTNGSSRLTDGPFAETTEQLGGFYLVEAPDLDTMTELCEMLPHGYTIEIRPVIDLDEPSGVGADTVNA